MDFKRPSPRHTVIAGAGLGLGLGLPPSARSRTSAAAQTASANGERQFPSMPAGAAT